MLRQGHYLTVHNAPHVFNTKRNFHCTVALYDSYDCIVTGISVPLKCQLLTRNRQLCDAGILTLYTENPCINELTGEAILEFCFEGCAHSEQDQHYVIAVAPVGERFLDIPAAYTNVITATASNPQSPLSDAKNSRKRVSNHPSHSLPNKSHRTIGKLYVITPYP